MTWPKKINIVLSRLTSVECFIMSCSSELNTLYNTLYCVNLTIVIWSAVVLRDVKLHRHWNHVLLKFDKCLFFILVSLHRARLLVCLRYSRSSGTELKLGELRLESSGLFWSFLFRIKWNYDSPFSQSTVSHLHHSISNMYVTHLGAILWFLAKLLRIHMGLDCNVDEKS